MKQILNQHVPKNLTDRPKMGFGVPIDEWLRKPLRDWAENLLSDKKLEQEDILIQNQLELWKQHLIGKKLAI